MTNQHIYSKKAENYAKYRWDYAPEALRVIIETTGLSPTAQVADIGSGTGILTRSLAGCTERIFAVELNFEMQVVASRRLSGLPGCRPILAAAEAVPLPAGSVDLITVAQAIHWFDPRPARQEFLRILKPGGWLAILRNYGTDEDVAQAIGQISTTENGVGLLVHAGSAASTTAPTREKQPESFYFAPGRCLKLEFPFAFREDYETFLGSMLSASFMPDEDHPLFPRLERAARGVFERFSRDGLLEVHGITELWIGQMI